MKIINSVETGKYRIFFALNLMAIIVFLVFFFIEKYNFVYLFFAFISFDLYFFLLMKKPYYINFETTHKSIIFRFYFVHPFLRNPKAIEIPFHNFAGYEINKNFFGRQIILKVKKSGKLGQYKPLSLSIVPNEMVDKIQKELDTILKMKKL